MANRIQLGRLQKEVQMFQKDSFPGVSVWPAGNNLLEFDAQILGPAETVYAGGIFKLKVIIPERYPHEPPSVRFQTPIYHPNIDNGGRICLNILNMPPKGGWRPAINIMTVLKSISLLLADPNPDDGLMADITEEYNKNRAAFDFRARKMTMEHATQRGPAAGGSSRSNEDPASQSHLLQQARQGGGGSTTMGPSSAAALREGNVPGTSGRAAADHPNKENALGTSQASASHSVLPGSLFERHQSSTTTGSGPDARKNTGERHQSSTTTGGGPDARERTTGDFEVKMGGAHSHSVPPGLLLAKSKETTASRERTTRELDANMGGAHSHSMLPNLTLAKQKEATVGGHPHAKERTIGDIAIERGVHSVPQHPVPARQQELVVGDVAAKEERGGGKVAVEMVSDSESDSDSPRRGVKLPLSRSGHHVQKKLRC